MFCTDNTVLSCKFSSFSNRSLIILRAGSIGTDVKSAVTSYDVRHSPSWRVIFLALFTKSLILCTWWGDLPTSGLSTLLRTLATPQVTEPLLETIVLRGCHFYGFLVTHKTCGNTTNGIHDFICTLIQSGLLFDFSKFCY